MAGGILKGMGIVLLVLGGLLLVGGAAAAIYGLLVANQEEQRGVFADANAAELAEDLLVYGGAAAGVGAVLLLAGAILATVGGSIARREILRAVRAAPHAPPPAKPERTPTPAGVWVAAGVVGLLLVGALLVALDPDGGNAVLGAFGLANTDPAPAAAPTLASFDGRVQGGSAPIVGAFNTGQSDAVHEVALDPATYVARATLDWTLTPPTGASTLTLLLELASGDAWTELARAEGGPGLVLEAPPTDVASAIRARVFLGGAGAGDQEYKLSVVATPV